MLFFNLSERSSASGKTECGIKIRSRGKYGEAFPPNIPLSLILQALSCPFSPTISTPHSSPLPLHIFLLILTSQLNPLTLPQPPPPLRSTHHHTHVTLDFPFLSISSHPSLLTLPASSPPSLPSFQTNTLHF